MGAEIQVNSTPATATPAAITVGAAGAPGASTNEHARADHSHPAPGVATAVLAGFMSAADKAALDALVAGSVPSSRNLTAGAGLTGGGDLSADRTFDIGVNGDGSITVNANDIQVGILATDAQHGSRGGGSQHADATNLLAGFMSAADKIKLDALITNGVPDTRNLFANAGLTGGGDLSADRGFSVGANPDGSIVVNADDIQVGILATDTQHGSRGGGSTHALASGALAGFMSAADFTKLAGIATGATVDDKTVRVSPNDTTPSELLSKLVAGANVTLTEINDGGNETLEIAASGGVLSDELAKVSANDTTAGFLLAKLVAGANITLTEINDGGNETLEIASTAAGADVLVGVTAADTTPGFLDDKIIPGAGLTRTILNPAADEDLQLDVVANADGSIVVNANDIQVGILATDAQHGTRGGGTQHAIATGALAGFMSAADKTKLDGLPTSAVPTSRNLTAGAGLTGGGDLSADRTFDVVANADGSIVVNANDIQVGVLASDAQHGNLGGGSLHALATGAINGFMSSADFSKLAGYPATPAGIDHNTLTNLGVGDVHTMYPLSVGRVGGQTITGSPTSGQNLTLEGSSGANPGFINANSPIIFGSYSANPSAAYGFSYTATENLTAAFIGGGLNFSGNITFTNSTFIYESFRGAPTITTGTTPGFSGYTVLQALPRLVGGALGAHRPMSPLIVNAGPQLVVANAVTHTVPIAQGMNCAIQLRGEAFGGVLNVTTLSGISFVPSFSTVAGSTINFGTIRAVHAQNPAQALFGTSAGTELMTAYIGLDVDAIPFGGNVTKAAVRSALVAASNTRLILNTSNAASDFGAGLIHLNDAVPLALGGSVTTSDLQISWNGVTNRAELDFLTFSGQIQISNASTDRFLFNTDAGSTSGEFNWNCARFSLGAQIGAVGNQVGVFVAGARTVTVPGGWSDFLLTQGANVDLNGFAMSQVFGWTINAPTITASGGTSTDSGALLVGGNVNVGTNRYGVYILSNPTGGTLNYSLRTAGATRVDGDFEHTGTNWAIFGATPTTQPAAYTRTATVVESRTLAASASATVTNNNNVLAALIADLQSLGIIG